MSTRESVHVLLVEDDEIDIESMRRTLSRHRVRNPLTVARDGVEALEFLRGENGRERIPSPFCVLLDLNLPRMSGLELLEEIRSDPALKGTVVFVMSSSEDDRDVLKAYEHHVAGYIVKQNAGRLFTGVVEMLDRYWQVVHIPESSA